MVVVEGWLFTQDDVEGACVVAVEETGRGSSVTITLLYAPCFHREVVEARPNPRKKWPDDRTCPGCKKKRRVCEIHVTGGGGGGGGSGE